MDLTHERDGLEALRVARRHMLVAAEINRSRELSVALTQAETAILWLERDYHVKLSKGEESLSVQLGDVLR